MYPPESPFKPIAPTGENPLAYFEYLYTHRNLSYFKEHFYRWEFPDWEYAYVRTNRDEEFIEIEEEEYEYDDNGQPVGMGYVTKKHTFSHYLRITLWNQIQNSLLLINAGVAAQLTNKERKSYLLKVCQNAYALYLNLKQLPIAVKYEDAPKPFFWIVKIIRQNFPEFSPNEYIDELPAPFRSSSGQFLPGFGFNGNVPFLRDTLFEFEFDGHSFIDREVTLRDDFIKVFSTEDLADVVKDVKIQLGCSITIGASIFYALKQSKRFPKLTFQKIEKSGIFFTKEGKPLTATNISNHKDPGLIQDVQAELTRLEG